MASAMRVWSSSSSSSGARMAAVWHLGRLPPHAQGGARRGAIVMRARGWRAARPSLALIAAAVAVAAAVGACQPPPPPAPKPPVLEAACAHTLTASTVGTIASNALAETSGIAASRRASGVWWVHNDSGDRARVFAIGNDGRDLGEFDLAGAAAVDWEDIAVGPGPSAGTSSLYLADIGDKAK